MCTGTHPYIPVPGTAKVEIFFRSDEQQIENVFHVNSGAGWDHAGLQSLGVSIDNWVKTNYKLTINDAVDYVGWKCTDLSSSSGAVAEATLTTPVPGAVTGSAPLPSNVSLAVKWYTAKRGRSYRGRTFAVGLSESAVAANTVQSSYLSALTDAMSGLMSTISAGGYTMVVASLCNEKAWRTTGVFTPITGFSIDTTVDSQRRRLPGRGR